jgi:hypothetical protein
MVSLANNHVLDYEQAGLLETHEARATHNAIQCVNKRLCDQGGGGKESNSGPHDGLGPDISHINYISKYHFCVSCASLGCA